MGAIWWEQGYGEFLRDSSALVTISPPIRAAASRTQTLRRIVKRHMGIRGKPPMRDLTLRLMTRSYNGRLQAGAH
jgi:hypothetical protein